MRTIYKTTVHVTPARFCVLNEGHAQSNEKHVAVEYVQKNATGQWEAYAGGYLDRRFLEKTAETFGFS